MWSEKTENKDPNRAEYDIGREEQGRSRAELARSQFQRLPHAGDVGVADVTAVLET